MGLSTNTYTYTGGPKTFAVNFADGFLERDHVTVYRVGDVDGMGNQVYLTFTWNSDSEVLVSDALANGDEIVVERTVEKQNLLVDLDNPGALTREALERNARQTLHAVHEALDGRWDYNLREVVTTARDETVVAKDAAETARDQAQGFAADADLDADQASAARSDALTYRDQARTARDEAIASATTASFASRPAAVTWVAGNTVPDGTIISDGTVRYIAKAGATAIADMPGWLPFGRLTVDHFGTGQSAQVSAVAYALDNGVSLHWLTKEYTSTGNIPNLHAVHHTGRGSIRRGSDTFYPAPVGEQPNTIYVSTTGSAANDGLTASQPLSYRDVRDVLGNYGPILGGVWRVEFAAGTYSVTSAFGVRLGPDNEVEADATPDELTRNHLWSANYITLAGPDVGYDPGTNPEPVPTAIFDAGNSASSIFDFRGGVRAYVKDIRFINADGSSSSNGVLCTNGALRAENVHTMDCTYGISGLEHCLLEVKGGALYGTSTGRANTGIRSLFNTKHDIGNQQAGSSGQGPFIRNCNIGLFCQEGATGHSDFVTYENNKQAIRARVSSRVNTNGSNFVRNNVCGISDTTSNIGWNGNENFNIGTADENDATFYPTGRGSVLYTGSEGTDHVSYPVDYQEVLRGTGYAAHTGTTAETVIHTLSLPTGAVFKTATSVFPGAVIRFRAVGTITGTAGTKIFRVRMGDQGGLQQTYAGTVLAADANGGFVYEGEIVIKGPVDQVSWARATSGFGSGDNQVIGSYTHTNDLTVNAPYDLSLRATLGNSADTVEVYSFSVEIAGML